MLAPGLLISPAGNGEKGLDAVALLKIGGAATIVNGIAVEPRYFRPETA